MMQVCSQTINTVKATKEKFDRILRNDLEVIEEVIYAYLRPNNVIELESYYEGGGNNEVRYPMNRQN